MSKLVRVKHYDTYWQAGLALNILEAHGIQGFLQRGNATAASKFTATSDFDLLVASRDYDQAKEILD